MGKADVRSLIPARIMSRFEIYFSLRRRTIVEQSVARIEEAPGDVGLALVSFSRPELPQFQTTGCISQSDRTGWLNRS